MNKAIYPGTFDPVTLGHLDIIERASRMFEQLIVGVGRNPSKQCLFTLAERMAMLREDTKSLPNVVVCSFPGLLVDFARGKKVSIILRGVRTVTDFEYELQMATANRASAGVETIFMTPRPEYEFVSARLIKELAGAGGDVSCLVSPNVVARLRARFAAKRKRS